MKKPCFHLKIHPITIIYIILALYTKRFVFLFMHYFVAFVHEIAHCICAKTCKFHIQEFAFLPFGFYAKIEDFDNRVWWKQTLILIAGPLSYFLSWGIFTVLYHSNIVSIYGYRYAMSANLLVLAFNLLPIYPMDGGGILRLIFLRFFSEKTARLFSLLVTIITSAMLFWRCLEEKQLVIGVFILFNAVLQVLAFKKDYYIFLLRRLAAPPKYQIKISYHPIIYRFNDNYYQNGSHLFDERRIIQYLLKQEKKAKPLISFGSKAK